MLSAQVEALRRAIVEGHDDEAAAAAIGEAVAGGASAENVMEQLVAAYNASLGTAARSHVALAITIDLIRRGEVARWIALRGGGRKELDVALLEVDKSYDVRAAVLALASVEDAISTVAMWCRRDPERRMEDLAANLADDGVVAFARELRDYEPREPLVARLAEILARRKEAPLRTRAAEQLVRAAALRCDIRVARDALRGALDDVSYYGSPAGEAAHALALLGEELDRDPRAAVRMGASRARVNFLGLLDPEPSNRARIAAELRDHIAKDAALCPSRDELQCLVAELLDPVVAEVVYAVIDRGDVASVIASLEARGMTRHLVAAARAVLDHAPPPVCRTCRAIPRIASSSDSSPRGLSPANEEGESVVHCLECGAAYHVETTSMDDIYGSYRTRVERLPAEDATEVARWRDRLDHPEVWVRRDAAWILALRAAKKRDRTTIDELVTHLDVEVRREAWRVMPIDTMRRALDDTDDEIREYAAGQLAEGGDAAVLAHLLRLDPVVASVAAVRASWDKSYPDNVVQALRARMLAARGQSKPDKALDSVCRMLGGALARRPDQRIVAEAIEIAMQSPPAIQVCMLNLLAGCIESADTSALDDTLAALLRHPETRTAATQLLRDRAKAHLPLRVDHLQALAAVDIVAHSHMAIDVFAEAVRVETTRSVGFAGLVAFAGKADDTAAAPRIRELAQEVPLGDAVPHLLALAERVTSGYVRQELVRALIVDAKRRRDRAFVASLLDHPNPGIAQVARSAERR